MIRGIVGDFDYAINKGPLSSLIVKIDAAGLSVVAMISDHLTPMFFKHRIRPYIGCRERGLLMDTRYNTESEN